MLCFLPCSLVNIYNELAEDIPGFQRPPHGNLTGWAEQGGFIRFFIYFGSMLSFAKKWLREHQACTACNWLWPLHSLLHRDSIFSWGIRCNWRLYKASTGQNCDELVLCSCPAFFSFILFFALHSIWYNVKRLLNVFLPSALLFQQHFDWRSHLSAGVLQVQLTRLPRGLLV